MKPTGWSRYSLQRGRQAATGLGEIYRSGRDLNANSREQLEDRLTDDWCLDPDERPFGIEPSVEAKDDAVCREEKRKHLAERIAERVADIEADGEEAVHRPLEFNAEK